MDNDNLRGLAVSGTINSDFTIDGSSNVVSGARVGIQPPADAIQEFKVETAAYDAQVGHTGAGSVNLALKSGTNLLRGAASYFNRDDSRSANLFASNARGSDGRRRATTTASAARSAARSSATAPSSWARTSACRTTPIETFTTSVPTERMRRGDFSELLAAGTQIYNPYSARLVNGVVTRDPFPGNVIPQNLLNPIALNVLKYYPLPNQAGDVDTTGNYFVEQPWTYGYDFEMARVDHQWNAPNRTYVRWTRNFRREERYNWAGEQNGHPITQGSTDRFNLNVARRAHGGAAQRLVPRRQGAATCASTTTSPRTRRSMPPASATPPRRSGCSATTTTSRASASSRAAARRPARSRSLGGQQNGFNTGRAQPFYNLQFAPTITRSVGAHTVKAGYDWRPLRQTEINQGWRGGAYGFDSGFTRASATAHRPLRPGRRRRSCSACRPTTRSSSCGPSPTTGSSATASSSTTTGASPIA